VINERQVKETLLQYERHGWNLRRVLLSAESFGTLTEASRKTLFGETEIVSAASDAAWFSRPSLNSFGNEAWELRNLSGLPFALIEVFEAEDDEEVRGEARADMETQLETQTSKNVNRKPSG
jgi:hypothetical protein